MKIGEKFICKVCGKVVERGERLKHIKEEHTPTDFFSVVVEDEWEE